MSKYKTSLEKYRAGREMAEQGATAKEIAEKLGYKNAASWAATRRYYEEQFKGKLGEKSAETDRPGALPDFLKDLPEKVAIEGGETKTSMTGPTLTLGSGYEKGGGIVGPGYSGSPPPAARVARLGLAPLTLEMTMQGRFLTFSSDGKSLGLRHKGSRDRFLRLEVDDADEFIAEIRSAVRKVRDLMGVEP